MGSIHEDKKIITVEEEDTIWSWNTDLPPTPDRTIAQVFSAQVVESPDALAVEAPDGTLTYAQLDNYSTRLALHLRTTLSNVMSDEVVPICFDKSIWLVVCMMAVSKAGMAYTTFDPNNPTERLHACLRIVNPRVILAEEKYKERFSDFPGNIVANLIDICSNPSDGEIIKTDLPVGLPSDLAYVCFTSGSTGLPKAVQHTQSSAVSNVVHGHGHQANSRILNFASQAFAASIVTTLKTLCNGGLIVLPPERERMGGIANFITKKGITRTVLTPTVMSMLKPEDVQCLEALLVGGEPVSKQLIDIWAPHLTLIEAIGMTEGVSIANIMDTSGKKTRARQYKTGCAWIVDPDDTNTLVPIGATGELLFEGPALFQGYRDDPEANSKAFVEELPLWAKKRGENRPKRLFRTGDLAKYVEDGVVQIVGRKDTRVKLYGQRFELGEVEKAMMDCLPSGASVAAEIVKPTSDNGPMLVAFIHGLSTNFSQEMKRLRERMTVSLPGYMVPRGFVELQDRPLNPSGKLDRKLLRQRAAEMPLVELIQHTGSSDKAAPVTSQEKTMQHLWATVLGLPSDYIGLEDDFFFLGGDSLHCIKLIAEARKENASLSIEDILEHRTLQAMSAAASFGVKEKSSTIDNGDRSSTLIAIATGIPEENIEHIALATDWQAWCIGQGLLNSHGWHDYMIFKFSKALHLDRLRKTCQQLVERHAILRTVFFVKAKKAFQVILKPEAYPFQFTVQQSGGEEIDELVKTTIQKDIKRDTKLGDPLVAFTLIEDPKNATQQLIFRISHAQYDAISLNKLWRSLEALYRMEPLEVVPFTEFCQEASLTHADSESFWKERLANSSMTEVRSHTRPSVDCPVDSVVKRKIPLVDLKAAGFTSATAVLASWSVVLSKLTARDSVVFGYLISGRHLPIPGISDVLGPCMNVLPMRADISPTAETSSLLNSVQSNYLKSLQHGHLGHYHIIENCTSWPRWTRFSTIVNHLSFEMAEPPFSGIGECAFSILEPEHDKSDLWLQTMARGQELEIELRYSAKAFPEDWVAMVTDYFVQVYEQLPHMLECRLAKNLPLLGTTLLQNDGIAHQHQVEEASAPSVEQSKALEELVLTCWESVLGTEFRSHAGFTYATPFYEIWGNNIGAAALASEYHKRGVQVSCEQVLEHPSVGETVAYLLLREKSTTMQDN